MVTERRVFYPTNTLPNSAEQRELIKEQTRPIFETEGLRRVYKHPCFSYYPDDEFILKSGRKIGLTSRENSIFIVFAENASQVVSHADIGISDNVLRQYIAGLKRKLQPRPEDPQIIHSIGEKRYILEDQSRLSDKQDFGGFVYRHKRDSVEARDNHEVFLTIREKKVLDFLIRHLDEVAERNAIAKALYEDEEDTTSIRLQLRVNKCVQGVRKKIGDFEQEDGTFKLVVVVPGKGYKLIDPAVAS